MMVVFHFSPHFLQQKLNRIDRHKVGRSCERGLSQLFVVLSAVQFIHGWLSQLPEPHLFLKQLKFHNNISPLLSFIAKAVTGSTLNTPALDAVQMQFPASLCCKFAITNSPLICWLRPTGSWPPCFLQLMIGCGSPVALQFSLTPVRQFNSKIILEGGLDVKRGRDTTTRSVFLSTFPRRFSAEQI